MPHAKKNELVRVRFPCQLSSSKTGIIAQCAKLRALTERANAITCQNLSSVFSFSKIFGSHRMSHATFFARLIFCALLTDDSLCIQLSYSKKTHELWCPTFSCSTKLGDRPFRDFCNQAGIETSVVSKGGSTSTKRTVTGHDLGLAVKQKPHSLGAGRGQRSGAHLKK